MWLATAHSCQLTNKRRCGYSTISRFPFRTLVTGEENGRLRVHSLVVPQVEVRERAILALVAGRWTRVQLVRECIVTFEDLRPTATQRRRNKIDELLRVVDHDSRVFRIFACHLLLATYATSSPTSGRGYKRHRGALVVGVAQNTEELVAHALQLESGPTIMLCQCGRLTLPWY